MAANLTTGLLTYLFSFTIGLESTVNVFDLPVALYERNARVMVVGVLALALDVGLLILAYEAVGRIIKAPLLRIAASTSRPPTSVPCQLTASSAVSV